MIDLQIKQKRLEGGETAFEEFKSALASVLNTFVEDRHANERWSVSKISENDTAYLVYDERPVASLKIESGALHIEDEDAAPRQDDIMYAIRYVASRLDLKVYSGAHGGARLPQDCALSLDHSYFQRDKNLQKFFEKSDFIPRFAREGMETMDDGRQALTIYLPYFAENKEDGSIHILNGAMLLFLAKKEDQRTNKEFSYKVADSLDDFSRKYDLGLIPAIFYNNYGKTPKIINNLGFDETNINRKVFIDPYVWNFDDEHDHRFYANTDNGVHLMDKVRKGEDLDTALKRVLSEELKVADDYVGARIWGMEFDRDREGVLTPRLKIHVFVRGLAQKQRSQSHDWVSLN